MRKKDDPEAYKEYIAAKVKAYWSANPEEKSALNKAYRDAHKDEMKVYQRAYRALGKPPVGWKDLGYRWG